MLECVCVVVVKYVKENLSIIFSKKQNQFISKLPLYSELECFLLCIDFQAFNSDLNGWYNIIKSELSLCIYAII